MNFTCLRWEQLPGIALYMDQVLLVLNQSLAPLGRGDEPVVTATMINNYVKMKLAAPAVKKKYEREHLARFTMICLLKKVFSMAEIGFFLDGLLEKLSLEQVYGLFCRELEHRLAVLDGAGGADCPQALAVAVRAVAAKIHVEKWIEENSKKEKEKP